MIHDVRNVQTPEERAAEGIDAHYDAMLYDGMPAESAQLVEKQRAAAHADLTEKIFKRALAQPMRSERW